MTTQTVGDGIHSIFQIELKGVDYPLVQLYARINGDQLYQGDQVFPNVNVKDNVLTLSFTHPPTPEQFVVVILEPPGF